MKEKILIDKGNTDHIINITKIAIITFVSISLIGNFVPFYTDVDSLVYGITTINIANGSYEYSSNLLNDTGLWEFVPVQWVKTIHDTAIPITGVGIYGFSTISYILGGNYGLFYIGPILSILFLVSSERIATNLFGKLVGLFTLIFLTSNFIINIIGRQLMTDNIFALFLILGCFYLVKFFREDRNHLLLYSSIFFTIATFIRPPGFIFFLLEILLVIGFFFYQTVNQRRKKINLNSSLSNQSHLLKLNKKKFFKIGIFFILPWLIFILFWLSFNVFYFGDPLTSYADISPKSSTNAIKTPSTFFQLDSKFIEYTKYYSVPLLPDVIKELLVIISGNEKGDDFTNNWISIFPILIFVSALAVSLYYKTKRTEVIIFILFTTGWISFYSSNFIASPIENHPTSFLRYRYMIPMMPFSFILFGFIIHKIWEINLKKVLMNRYKFISVSFKISFVILVFILLSVSLLSSKPVEDIFNNTYTIENPQAFAEKYPPDREGLPENSVIVGDASRKAIAYNATIFFPYWGMGRYSETTPDTIPKEPIITLKKIMEQGYETYMFKGGASDRDVLYFRYLEAEHGIVLKDFSKTFCKLELVEKNNMSETESQSDELCYSTVTQSRILTR